MCTWVLRDYNPWIQAGQRARGVGLTPCEKGRGVGLRGCLCLRTKRIRVPPVVGQTPPALASRHALFQEEEEGEGGRGAARDQALPTLDASTGAGIVTHAHTATTQPSLAHAPAPPAPLFPFVPFSLATHLIYGRAVLFKDFECVRDKVVGCAVLLGYTGRAEQALAGVAELSHDLVKEGGGGRGEKMKIVHVARKDES